MGKQKRRTRSPHSGVVLKRRTWRSGTSTWLARWTDPDTGKVVDTNLSKLGLTTHEARREWAITRSRSLSDRRAALAAGAPTRTSTDLHQAIEDYFAYSTRLSPRTIQTYREGVDRFQDWARRCGVQTTEALTPARLAGFRDALSNEPRRQAQSGAPRGSWAASDTQRSPYTLNRDLCSVRAMINAWRRSGLVPDLNLDGIKDALRSFQEPRPRPAPLKPAQLRDLLAASVSHDGGVRETLAGFYAPCRKPQDPTSITPFVLFVLLTGCRLGEALSLKWSDIDFDAGLGAGEIVLQASATKTRHERAVDLSVAPSLCAMLKLLKLRSGGRHHVFGGDGPLSEGKIVAARKRLTATHKAPDFSWQRLRQTAGSYLTNAPGIFGAASAFRSAQQLGHSVTVAERHYVGVLRVDRSAETLEQAMGIERPVGQITGFHSPVDLPAAEGAP